MNVTVRDRTQHFRTVTFDRAQNAVRLIEQRRLLPHEFKIVATSNFRTTAAAITDMIVRGAGAIGAAAAYGLAQGALAFRGNDLKKFSAHIETVYQVLKNARPTAVDPVNAMKRCAPRNGAWQKLLKKKNRSRSPPPKNLPAKTCSIARRSAGMRAKLIRNGMKILTHCNAGWLAFVDIGTATAPMYAAQAQGKKFHVFCDETRRVRRVRR